MSAETLAALADLAWWAFYALAVAAIPFVLHELWTGIRRFILIRRRARLLRALRDTAPVRLR